MKDYHINIFWSDEDGGHIADIPDLGALVGAVQSTVSMLGSRRDLTCPHLLVR